MKTYEAPKANVVKFDVEDIILVSGSNNATLPYGGPNNGGGLNGGGGGGFYAE